MENLAIYIHWPFCKSKCPYCDFNSHVRAEINEESWNKAYIKQIESYRDLLKGKKIVSIFFGGGTPSLMPGFIVANIINELAKHAILDSSTEITLEANPTSVEANKFKEFSRAGINRVSLGIQSLDDQELKFLGREHNKDEAIKAISLARECFNRYSFDLIYALPNQKLADWEKQLLKALEYAGKHLSLYQLTIEKGTKFYSLHKQRKFKLPEEELARDFYLLTQSIMNEHNLPAYEISNHATIGEECRHNLVYWKYDDFLGIGPGAHSRIKNIAMNAVYNPEEWLNKALKSENLTQNSLILADEDILLEAVLMGLRLSEGIKESDLVLKTGKDFSSFNSSKLNYYIEQKMLKINDNSLSATLKGKLVLNHIIENLLY